MHIVISVHSLTSSLNRILQTENLYLKKTIELADAANHILIGRRGNVGEQENFQNREHIGDEFDIKVRKPRFTL